MAQRQTKFRFTAIFIRSKILQIRYKMLWCYRSKSNINVWLFKTSEDSISRHHYHQSFFFGFLYIKKIYSIFHKVCFNPFTNVTCFVNIVWTLFDIRVKIAAFQIKQPLTCGVLERLLSFDHLYYPFLFHLQGSCMKERKTTNSLL